jgi:transcription elongation factor Elf1
MSDKKEFQKAKARLEDEVRRTKSLLKELESHCTHQKKNGRLDLSIVDAEKNIFKCNQCGALFSIAIRPKDEIIDAVDVIRDAVNQIKALSSDEHDDKFIKRLGSLLADIEEVPVLYVKLILERGKSGKGKGNNNNGGNRPGYRGKFGAHNTNIY